MATFGCLREAGDQLVDLRLDADAAGRVGGRVDDDQPRLRRDAREHVLRLEAEAVLFEQRQRHRRGAGELDGGLVDREAGVRIDDLGAGLAEHRDREIHRHLAAGHDQHVGRIDVDAVAAVQVGGHRLAHLGDAVGRGVAVVAVLQRLDRRLDDMARGLEVGLADAEADDGLALGLQRLGAGQDLERRFGAKAAHAARQLKHVSYPLCSPEFAVRAPQLAGPFSGRILWGRPAAVGGPDRQDFAE